MSLVDPLEMPATDQHHMGRITDQFLELDIPYRVCTGNMLSPDGVFYQAPDMSETAYPACPHGCMQLRENLISQVDLKPQQGPTQPYLSLPSVDIAPQPGPTQPYPSLPSVDM